MRSILRRLGHRFDRDRPVLLPEERRPMNSQIYAICSRVFHHAQWIPFRTSRRFGSYPPCWRLCPHRVKAPGMAEPNATSACPGQACICKWWLQKRSAAR